MQEEQVVGKGVLDKQVVMAGVRGTGRGVKRYQRRG